MSERREGRRGQLADVGVGVLQAVAVLGAALWFRNASERYAVLAVVASIAALALRWKRPRFGPDAVHQREIDRGTAVLFALASFLVATPAVQVARARATHPENAAVAAVAAAVAPTLATLERTARTALTRAARAGGSPRAVFEALAPLADSGDARRGERAVAVLDARGTPLGWAGTWRVRPDSLDAGVRTGVVGSPFYVVLYATASGGGRRAVAATVLHAEPPADVLARALDAAVLRESGLRGLEVRALEPSGSSANGAPTVGPEWWTMTVPGSAARLALRAVPPDPAAVRAQLLDDARRVAAPGVTLMTMLAAAALWRLGARTRLSRASASTAGLALPLVVLALTPLGALSNATRFFDPAVYFSPIGGALTSTVGALAATGAVALLAVATAWHGTEAAGRDRWRGTLRAYGGALAGAVVFVLGAHVVRDLARGISPPPGGATPGLFIAWQGAFCLLIAAVLLWVVGLVRPLRERFTRGEVGPYASLFVLAGPIVAAVVAVVGATQWSAPDGWPTWYPALWAIPAALVVLARANRAVIPAAITVAGLGASTLVWGATMERQVALAERDVRALAMPDADALTLLARFGRTLATDPAPAGDPAGAALLRRYALSALAAAGYPVSIARWDTASVRDATATDTTTRRAMSPLEHVGFVLWGVDTTAVVGAIREAAATHAAVTRAIAADPGAATLLAVPQRDGRIATVTLFPRAQFVTIDPLDVLLAGGQTRVDEPPYLLSLLHEGRRVSPMGATRPEGVRPPPNARPVPLRWTRGDEIAHAEAEVLLPDGPAAAHVEVMLGSLGVLAERAALLVFGNLLVIGVLWWLPSLDAARWPRPRRGWQYWMRSYRARLTAALFGFFAVPTLVFAAWTFAQLQAGDREARTQLVRETLRAAMADGALSAGTSVLPPVAARLGAPLLAYERGVLTAASEPALVPLAPLGRLMPVAEMLSVAVGDELTATIDGPAALGRALIGFRAGLTTDGRRVILATPARSDDVLLDQRRRDLGFLVLLAAMTGALAALWLSGVAARQLARPVGSLRRAAVALARGKPGLSESDPASLGRGAHRVAAALHREPPAEFRPVFGAFRHMASELDASHVELEAARRRTGAVLRDVASGVIAVDAAACVTVANPRAAALLGRPLEVGRPLDLLVPPEIAGPMREFLADAAAGVSPEGPDGRDVAFEVTLRGRQLRARLTTLGAVPGTTGVSGLDAVELVRAAQGAVLTLDDVTDLAHAQRALAWGEMARQVAHEIKNPLTPIRLGVQLLRRAYRDGRGDFGVLLEANAERVLAEIDRLDEIARAFSRYGTTPAHAPAPEPADVAAIARDVVALERLGTAEGAGQAEAVDGGHVQWELDAPDRASAWARDGELREVVLNLLENARLAGARRVQVTVAPAARSGHHDGAGVVLSVRDDGCGIAPDVLPRIFDPHFSTRTSGSGLGLAIARRLVDGWGGRIAAESVEGEGTTVTVALRAADGPA